MQNQAKQLQILFQGEFAANERMQKIRDHPEMEQTKTENRTSPANSPDHKRISDPARTEA